MRPRRMSSPVVEVCKSNGYHKQNEVAPPTIIQMRHYIVQVRHEHHRVHTVVSDPTEPRPEAFLHSKSYLKACFTQGMQSMNGCNGAHMKSKIIIPVKHLIYHIKRDALQEEKKEREVAGLAYLVSPEWAKGCSHPPTRDIEGSRDGYLSRYMSCGEHSNCGGCAKVASFHAKFPA